MKRHHLIIGGSITTILVGWFIFMSQNELFHLFKDNWFMSVTMMFGSFIAGATSEGGGAIAFPVMTLIFKIVPSTARDFSLMIQSFGMMMATITILALGIRILPGVAVVGSLGGAIGIALGFILLKGLFPPPFVKMFFTTFWLGFGWTLFRVRKMERDLIRTSLDKFGLREVGIFFLLGVLGGAISSLTGSGIDIVTFAILTLSYGVCIKVATPTSVFLMGVNALVGFLFKHHFAGGMAPEAWNYLYVCIPIVIFGAPFGAAFIRDRSRLFIENLLIFSITAQFIYSLVVIPQSKELLIFSFATLVGSMLLFGVGGRYFLSKTNVEVKS